MAEAIPIDVHQTEVFRNWFAGLSDRHAKIRIDDRLVRLQDGNPGDSKSVGDGVIEMRIAVGPGYRIYYTRIGRMLVILLCGGDKDSQPRDIAKAKEIARRLKDGYKTEPL